MTNAPPKPAEVRDLLKSALPVDTSLHGKAPELRHLYLPSAHVKALRPDNMLVTGIRGSGKSFWWAALQEPDHRQFISRILGISGKLRTSTGFGEGSSPGKYPGRDTITSLLQKHDPRRIWQTIVIRHVALDVLPDSFRGLPSWSDRVSWTGDNPESVENGLAEADRLLVENDEHHLVLFDALDRTADDWRTMHALVRGLLQVVLDFRSYRRLRLKVFVRPDHIEDPSVSSFPDASKVLSQKTDLIWPRHELYGLLWQYLSNDSTHGHLFQEISRELVVDSWSQAGGVWRVPQGLRTSEETQKAVFHRITGDWMGRDHRRGFPYSWLPGHLADARRQVSPRSFLAAVRHAAEDAPRVDHPYALHYESIKRGVQEASKIRVREVEEDYPWVQELLRPLAGISVPCAFEEIRQVWDKKSTLKGLAANIAETGVRLPPSHLSDGAQGVLSDLVGLGMIEQLLDGRINLPDVYRVGYGMGRRGGVRPLARTS